MERPRASFTAPLTRSRNASGGALASKVIRMLRAGELTAINSTKGVRGKRGFRPSLSFLLWCSPTASFRFPVHCVDRVEQCFVFFPGQLLLDQSPLCDLVSLALHHVRFPLVSVRCMLYMPCVYMTVKPQGIKYERRMHRTVSNAGFAWIYSDAGRMAPQTSGLAITRRINSTTCRDRRRLSTQGEGAMKLRI
jgi:hypothetical protein